MNRSDGTTDAIDPNTVERLKLQEELAAAAGFSLPPPIYALGTPVLKIGQDNFSRSRTAFEKLPLLVDSLPPFLERISQEARRDTPTRIIDVKMLPDGRICRDPAKAIYLDGENTLRGLLARTECTEPGAAAKYLAAIPAPRRAAEVNAWLADSDPNKTMVIRSRRTFTPDAETGVLTPYGRETYAIVSDRYGTGLEVDQLGLALHDNIKRQDIPGDARCEIAYDGRVAEFRALWHSNVDPKLVAAGEVFKAGAVISAADDTSLALHVDASVHRNLCLNFLIIGEATKDYGSRRHVGSTAELVRWLREAFFGAMTSVSGFAKLWDTARSTPWVVRDLPVDATPEGEVKGVFRGLLKTGRLTLPGMRRKDAVDELYGAWLAEPERTRVGVVNAATRVAHISELRGMSATRDLEELAGSVLRSTKPFDWVPEKDDF